MTATEQFLIEKNRMTLSDLGVDSRTSFSRACDHKTNEEVIGTLNFDEILHNFAGRLFLTQAWGYCRYLGTSYLSNI